MNTTITKLMKKTLLKIFSSINTTSDINYWHVTTLKNFVVFFLTSILNLQKNLNFLLCIFFPEKDSANDESVYNIIIKIGNNLDDSDSNTQLKEVINALYLKEFKNIFFRSPRCTALENFFIESQLRLSNTIQKGIPLLGKESYEIILDMIINLSFSYDNLDSFDKFSDDSYKVDATMSLIRIIFSKEKYRYYSSESFEYDFMHRLIYKCIMNAKEKKISEAFSGENAHDDMIKNIFSVYGSEMVLTAFVNPMNSLINFTEKNGKLNNNSFITFFNEMINGLKNTMPMIIRIILRMVYNITHDILKTEKTDYFYIYFILFVRFLLQSKIQNIFDIKAQKFSLICKIERNIKSICFSELKNVSDISEKAAKELHNKLNKFVEEEILAFNTDEMTMKTQLLKVSLFPGVLVPSFLFYFDVNNVIKLFPEGVKGVIVYEEFSK